MPRRPRPAEVQRSEHWLRVAVNQGTVELDRRIQAAFGIDPADKIRWLSPVQSDEYAEYFDQEFLDRLGLPPLKVPLVDFWPKSGPRWDGLARSDSGKVILVEAKAHIEEAVDFGSQAGSASKVKINNALAAAKAAYRASSDANWEAPLYQYANRLSHLYYLRKLNGCDAYLLFLYFADAPDVPAPCTTEQWEGAIRLAEKVLGLGSHAYKPFVSTVVWSVPDMLSNPSFHTTAPGRC